MKELSPLGKKISHKRSYDPSQLFPIERVDARASIGIEIPQFKGCDIWNCYEISWLNLKGKPEIALGRFFIPFDSKCIIESKSMKLYLNSFNQTRFKSFKTVEETIKKDLSLASSSEVGVNIIMPENFNSETIEKPKGECIDHLDIELNEYIVTPEYLKAEGVVTNEKLYSNLLRTNCPVTDQPDWATILIEYSGKKIERHSLLKYLVSFREHSGFHENCVETIYMDIMKRCNPEKLLVNARFTRRGGIDINPYRSNFDITLEDRRLVRQ